MITLIKDNPAARILACVALLLLSLALLGAHQVTREMNGRSDTRLLEEARWTQILSDLSEEIPQEHRSQWITLAQQKPESMLKSLSKAMR